MTKPKINRLAFYEIQRELGTKLYALQGMVSLFEGGRDPNRLERKMLDEMNKTVNEMKNFLELELEVFVDDS